MKPGLFFSIEQSTSPLSSQILFSYKRVVEGRSYPIYVNLGERQVSFYFNSQRGKENIRILSLNYSDFLSTKGKLTRQIESIRSKPSRSINSSQADFNLTYDRIPSYSYCYKKEFKLSVNNDSSFSIGHIKKGKYIQICLITLLLDFLFDSKQSEVFSLSPNFEQWLSILRENILLQAILAKVDFLYKRTTGTFKTLNIQLETYQFQQKALSRAEEKWIERIIDKSDSHVIAQSNWFNDNLEDELNFVLEKNERLKSSHPSSIKHNQISATVEWLIQRFNYIKAGNLLFKTHIFNQYLLISIAALPLLYFFIQFLSRNGFGKIDILRVILLTLPLLALIMIYHYEYNYKSFSSKRRTKNNIQAYNSIIYFSPPLLIAIFLSWGAIFKAKTSAQINEDLVFWTGLLDLVLVPIFLFKIIKDEAPDLPSSEVMRRIVLICIRVSIFISIIGIMMLDLYQDTRSDIQKYCCQLSFLNLCFCWRLLLNHFPFVFLSSVFIASIFRGKIFTGWFSRSLGK